MKQLLQNLRSGAFSLEESPAPSRHAGFVLVANRASLISAGTERSTVKAAQASLLGKARQRPDKVQQVLDNVRKEGLMATLRKVQEKLDQPKALGYSSAGVILETDPDDPVFRVGDRVACGGQDYASHAELVSVPRNLVVPIPEGLGFAEASFAAVGAIALQGVRRAELQLGSRALVVGLGLLGQLTWQLLRHSGCVAIGTDVSPHAVETARRLGLAHALVRGRDDVEGACAALSDGHGVDAVIITASADSKDPVELAGVVSRVRGRVVAVGAFPMDLPRDPHYYRKELDFVISRSYGPGRYDAGYEEGGLDYPYGFVRWTEGRNMASFLEAAAAGGVDLASLITHRFPLDQAEDAYRIVTGERSEPHIGIVLTYDEHPRAEKTVALRPVAAAATPGTLRIGFAGAGSFARSYLLPHLKGRAGVELVKVATAKGYTATDAAQRFGFAEAGSDAAELVRDPRLDAVFIATRHDHHGPLATAALAAGKHVFVEKPLAVSPEHLAELLPVAERAGRIVQTGFNRRFSPLAVALRGELAASAAPAQITYRVNAGPLPADHWLLDPLQGGGRVIGEGCHFVDLMQFLAGQRPVRVSASRFGADADGAVTATIEFDGGSVGVLVYQGNATPGVPKERLEAFAGGRGGIIHDWRSVEIHGGRSVRTVKASGQAKGYAEEVAAFLEAVKTGTPAIALESQVLTTAATFAILESIASGRPVAVRLPSAGA